MNRAVIKYIKDIKLVKWIIWNMNIGEDKLKYFGITFYKFSKNFDWIFCVVVHQVLDRAFFSVYEKTPGLLALCTVILICISKYFEFAKISIIIYPKIRQNISKILGIRVDFRAGNWFPRNQFYIF